MQRNFVFVRQFSEVDIPITIKSKKTIQGFDFNIRESISWIKLRIYFILKDITFFSLSQIYVILALKLNVPRLGSKCFCEDGRQNHLTGHVKSQLH